MTSPTHPGRGALLKSHAHAALAGDEPAVRDLIRALTPVVQARIARVLLRRRSRVQGDLRATLEDLVQDTFLVLFQDRGRLLRAWDPERGLKLESYVGLIAEQRVYATLRSRRKNPWTEELAIDDADLDLPDARSASPESQALSREALEDLWDELRARLSPMGLELFVLLLVRGEPTESVCARMNLSVSAVHAWSSRLRRLVHKLAGRDDVPRPAAQEVS